MSEGVTLLGDAASALRLFDRAAFASASYPRLQAVFERMVAASQESLREICPVPPKYHFRDCRTEPVGPALAALRDRSIIGIFYVLEWQSRIYMSVDRAYVDTLVEAFFGGDGSEPPAGAARRFSHIEKSIARAAMLAAVRSLQAALEPVVGLTIGFERIETTTEHMSADDLADSAVVARFDFAAGGQAGELGILIPQSAIRAARSNADAPPADGELSRRMQDKIQSTDITLSAVLEERRMTLVELASLRVGQVLPLDARTDGRIRLVCNGEALLLCEIGQSDGAFALRVDQVLKEQRNGA